jgi:hypothetical protein
VPKKATTADEAAFCKSDKWRYLAIVLMSDRSARRQRRHRGHDCIGVDAIVPIEVPGLSPADAIENRHEIAALLRDMKTLARGGR